MRLQKKNSRTISRILYSELIGMPVIYLEQVSPLASIDLPSNIERATLIALVYMVFQSIRRTAFDVTIGTVSSCLAFSPLPQ